MLQRFNRCLRGILILSHGRADIDLIPLAKVAEERRKAELAAAAKNAATKKPSGDDPPETAKKDPAACLQASRLWSFNVLDQRTVVLGDRDNNKFTVHMTGGCIGLTNIIDDLRVVTKPNLGCLTQGARIAFREPTLGRMTCFVTSVEADKPAPKS